ncbi:helix-turn-helix transcriptional regulator [Nonomuraea sp. NEAU-A123]|uniref:helix-turn-helix transcriptional regulator n=1 Tax=Nonomuraea sp. NEAU-A123 TaxID=2839649 RepID=UPI001BE4655E|nr:helix-turn-helix transcriptional regulator [Nonomuraea sp. NEAU-A123]MBT2225624.1 helix-turn-helix domain-containing protein [Nonomuraea sp. NEAU-A123]
MAEGNAMGEFLRARRELVRPEDVGIPELDRRRVPGLRRSELAMLAGISTEYYVRLEQGRDRHPSTMVLEALARALQLDEHATAHLHRLLAPAPRRAPRRRAEKVSPQIDVLLRSLDPTTPAYVTGRLTNVLAANTLATAVLPLLVPGTNFVRATFLDPIADQLYDDIEARRAAAAAGLRAFAGPDVDDPELTELVGELSVKSPDFRRLWSRHDVKPMHGALPRLGIRHPQLGPIDLYHQKLQIPGAGGQVLGLLYAEPGSRSEQAVAMLAAMMAKPEGHRVGRRALGLSTTDAADAPRPEARSS